MGRATHGLLAILHWHHVFQSDGLAGAQAASRVQEGTWDGYYNCKVLVRGRRDQQVGIGLHPPVKQ